MASPVSHGTLSSSPFIGKYVDITYEKIHILPDKDFRTAKFTIEYHIDALKNGLQIPLLFYAADYESGFNVWLDGKEVSLNKVPDYLNETKGITYHDFIQFYEREPWKDYEGNKETSLSNGFYDYVIYFDELKFFYADITKGKHVIKVEYNALRYGNGYGWVNEYSFRYALSPAKYWRSYGGLEVVYENLHNQNDITTNLGNPVSGNLDTKTIWKFTSLPSDFIEIAFIPEIPITARIFITITPGILGLCLALLLIAMHILIIKKYRRQYRDKKYSWVVIVGSILVPFFIILGYILIYPFIDSLIGKHASRHHGYLFLAFLFYPIIMPFYWLIAYIVDLRLAKKLRKHIAK